MVRATLRLRVQPGGEADLEAAWREVSEVVRRTPGNVRQSLLRDRHDVRCYVITSDWESERAFRTFERSPEQDDLTAPLRRLRESADMTVHDLVLHVEPAPEPTRAAGPRGVQG